MYYFTLYFSILKAGFVDRKPYRTCANRFCTPSDISLDSNVQIETCCRSNLCNSVLRRKECFVVLKSFSSAFQIVSGSSVRRLYKRSLSSHRTSTLFIIPATAIGTNIKNTTTMDSIDKIVEEQPLVLIDENSSNKQDTGENSSHLPFNKSVPNSFSTRWERKPYDEGISNRLETLNHILLFLIPSLLALFF